MEEMRKKAEVEETRRAEAEEKMRVEIENLVTEGKRMAEEEVKKRANEEEKREAELKRKEEVEAKFGRFETGIRATENVCSDLISGFEVKFHQEAERIYLRKIEEKEERWRTDTGGGGSSRDRPT